LLPLILPTVQLHRNRYFAIILRCCAEPLFAVDCEGKVDEGCSGKLH